MPLGPKPVGLDVLKRPSHVRFGQTRYDPRTVSNSGTKKKRGLANGGFRKVQCHAQEDKQILRDVAPAVLSDSQKLPAGNLLFCGHLR